MHPLRIALLFSAAVCGGSAQILPPFGPFQPVPPPRFFTFVVFPPVTLQAKAAGGLRASIPDDCGIESFEFESKRNKTDEWKGGNVTSKTEGNWIFDDPSVLLAPGDLLFYRCRIKHRGSLVSNPDAEWIVNGLVDEFEPPKPAKRPEECPEEPTTPKPEDKKEEPKTPKPDDKKEEPKTPKPDDKKEETTANPDEAEDEPTENPDDSTDKPEKKKSDIPNKKKSDKPEKTKQEGPKMGECPAPPPSPGETREESLERKLWQVQCDMLQLAERSFRINEALSNELTELKKLNYVVVTRIQRLESLVRNLNRPVPFPAVFPFN